MFGQLIFSFLILGIPSGTDLSLTTLPSGLEVWLDGTWHGMAPVTVRGIPPGAHHIRVASRRLWAIQPVDTVICLRPGLNRVRLTAPGTLHVVSDDAGARVLEDGREVGHSPLMVSREAAVRRRMSVRVGDETVHLWDWTPMPGSLTTVRLHHHPLRQTPARESGIRAAVLTGIAVMAMAASSAVLARRADDAYGEYQTTAHPDRMRTLFRRARRLDRWASGLWSGFEIGAAVGLAWWILAA